MSSQFFRPGVTSSSNATDGGGKAARVELVKARTHIENALQSNASWRALCQLEERERVGDWLDVIEGDVLRLKLLEELSQNQMFLALAHIGAALHSAESPAAESTELTEPEPPKRAAVADRLPTLAPSRASNLASVRIRKSDQPAPSTVPTAPAAPPAPVMSADTETNAAPAVDGSSAADTGKHLTAELPGVGEAEVIIRRPARALPAAAASTSSNTISEKARPAAPDRTTADRPATAGRSAAGQEPSPHLHHTRDEASVTIISAARRQQPG